MAELPISTQLFANAFSVGTNGLAHRIIGCNTFCETAADNDLLLWWRGILHLNAGFAVELPHGPLQYDAEVFMDESRGGVGEIERGFNAKKIESLAYP